MLLLDRATAMQHVYVWSFLVSWVSNEAGWSPRPVHVYPVRGWFYARESLEESRPYTYLLTTGSDSCVVSKENVFRQMKTRAGRALTSVRIYGDVTSRAERNVRK